MSALQSIRNNKWVAGIVGLALLCFIIEIVVEVVPRLMAESQQRIGEIYGEKINYQEFNAEVDEFSDFMRVTRGLTNLTDEQHSSIRDQVWQMLVSDKVIEHECERLGITVTEAELRDIITNGRNPLLAQTIFRTQQGTFDVKALEDFQRQYEEIMSNPEMSSDAKEQMKRTQNYWMFIEKTIRRQALSDKYYSLLSGLMVSNPVSAQASFDGRTNEADIYMAALPFTSIKDDDVKIEDSELKAKYEEMKEMFREDEETRDIKYIDVHVTASDADKDNLRKELEGYAQALAEGADPAKTVRESASQVAYAGVPVKADNLPKDITEKLDTLAVGSQVGPFVTDRDNTMNVVRLIGKVTLPDSVEIRQIFVGAPNGDMAACQKSADSIMTALDAGISVDSIAKKYDQTAEKTWVKLSQLEQDNSEMNRLYLNTINSAAVGSNNKIVFEGQGIIIVKVTDRRDFMPKYDVAVIKRPMDFSKETYNKAFSKFSSFLAGNAKLEDMEANADKEGYVVQTRNGVRSTEHKLVNVSDTREAMRWLFNTDTEVGDVSHLYECGEKDHMLVLVLTGIHEKGYISWDDEQVRTFLTNEVMKDKKAAMLAEKLNGVKSVADVAKIEGAVTDTIHHVSFGGNAFVSKLGSNEPVLSGSVSKAKAGEFKSGIKGKAAVYAYQVLDQKKTESKYDQKEEEQRLVQNISRNLGNWQAELLRNANITDRRYLFY